MTATRVMDENKEALEEMERLLNLKRPLSNDGRTKMINEAYLFMRDEVSVRGASSPS